MANSQEESEDNVPAYRLPDPLVSRDGSVVSDLMTWEQKRRPELLHLLADNVYGHFPEQHVEVKFEAVKEFWILDKTGRCREVDIRIGQSDQMVVVKLLVFLPKTKQPVGCFLGLNFDGNHSIFPDQRISLPSAWVSNKKELGITDHRAAEEHRGSAARRWPVELVLSRGYALATAYYGEIDPDFDDGFKNGIHPLFYRDQQTKPDENQWGSIGAWAWGLSRAMDYLEELPEIDSDRVAVLGHSRLGKTALWSGANDPRFSIVISNNSGCGGAAISRRRVGETVEAINRVFPHWFCDRFVAFNDRENELPIDQHSLIAMMAPRAVYVASATEDQWADPVGEYESLVQASAVFELYGNPPVAPQQPVPDQPVRFGRIGYHLRTGPHDIGSYDWNRYLDFADALADRGITRDSEE